MILSVQYLRAIASVMVLMHHAAWKGEQFSTNPMSWFHIGTAGVDLFFIISGYIMSYVTYNKNINYVTFLKNRILRIIPLYWILTTAALIIYLIYPEKINSQGGVTEIIHSYLLIPTSNKYLIQNGWTLSYELYFYALFSIGLFFNGKQRCCIPMLILFILVVFGRLYNSFDGTIFNFLSNQYLIEFVYGIAAFLYLDKYRTDKYVALFMIFISILYLFVLNNYGFISLRVVDYGLPCLILFIGVVSLEKYFIMYRKKYISILFGRIGESSYSLYLVHPFSLAALSIVMNKIKISQFGGFFVFLLIFFSIAMGYICYNILEKNLTIYLKSYFKSI